MSNGNYPNSDYIEYLNTLHNASANNQSAITELNITNPFFTKTMVDRDVGSSIMEIINHGASQLFILTGHAGDGKTGLLYQALHSWNVIQPGVGLEREGVVNLPGGKRIHYIKDFSELGPHERIDCLKKAIEACKIGESVFLVANTGPLITCFSECFSEASLEQLIEAIDSNNGDTKLYDGTPITVINVATLDNSSFVKPYLHNLLADDMWTNCAYCEKCEFCAILHNRCLIKQSSNRVSEFIASHYIFQQEHGEKLTIRQIVAHLAFSLTGGLECNSIKNTERAKFYYLFTNNFFGYRGTSINRITLSMKAINDIINAAYDQKRLRVDEELFIKGDLTSHFVPQVANLLLEEGVRVHHSEEWQRSVRRAYMMLNIDTGETAHKHLYQDVFSPWFPRYLQIRNGEPTSSTDKELIQDALQMMFTDTIAGKEKEIPITMKRENGVSQCVQLIYDSLAKKKIKLTPIAVNDYSKNKRYKVFMSVNGQLINTSLSLPLFDYFEEIRRGAISTDIDPMLSQGIDSLKAQIISFCEDDKTDIELLTLSDSGWESITAEYDSGDWIIN